MPDSDAVIGHEHSEDPRRVRRRYVAGSVVGALAAFVLFAVLLQGGRDGLFGRDLLGNFYDGQARAILDGRLDVPPDVPGLEGFVVGDKTYLYQGLVPVIARLPVVAVTSSLDGRLTGVSMLMAYAVLLGYVVTAGWRARRLIRGTVPIGTAELLLTALITFGIGTGLVGFLASRAWVYHEAAMWGVAFSLASLVHLAAWIESLWGNAAGNGPHTAGHIDASVRRPLLHVSLAVVFAGLAFNTRSSIGAGPLAALAITVGCVALGSVGRKHQSGPVAVVTRTVIRICGFPMPTIAHQSSERGRRTGSRVAAILIVVVGALASIAAYGAVNNARFGSLFGVPLEKQRLVENDPFRLDALEANDGSLFGLQYAPSVALQLLRPDALALRSVFPYIGFPENRPTVIGSALFAERDWSTSIPDALPLGFLAGAIGVFVIAAPRRNATDETDDTAGRSHFGVAAWRIPVFGSGFSGATIIVFGYMAQRYVTDFYPFVVLTSTLGLQWLASRLIDRGALRERRLLQWSVVSAVTVLALAGVWVTSSVTLQYQREVAPGYVSVNRTGWLKLQLRLPGSVAPIRVPDINDLPDGSSPGQVAIVGDCHALYRWTGTRWLMLEAGGGGDGAGVGLRVKVHSSRPLSSITSPIVLVEGEDAEGPIELRLVQLSGEVELRFSRGPDEVWPFRIPEGPDGFELDLDLTEDRLVDELVITPHGVNRELLVTYSGASGVGFRGASDNPPGVEVTASPLDTPICRILGSRTPE